MSSAGSSIGQLSDSYSIPAYARNMLYVVIGGGHALKVSGKQGRFHPAPVTGGTARIAWGTAEGPILAQWEKVGGANLQWEGRVKVGGFIERLHSCEVGGLEIVIAEVVGGPFPTDHVALPSLSDMRRGIFSRPSDAEPLAKDQVYPFIILADSNFAAFAQDAFVSGIAVDAYGVLAEDEAQWHEVVGLPLLLDMLTLLAP